MASEPDILSQAFTLGYTYTRSTGPVVGHFFSALRGKKIVGIKGSDGRVIVPPMEYDPITAEALNEFVEVAETGVVKSWCWVSEPRKKHLLQRPFAWIQVQLDGADVPMLHMLSALDASAVRTGMRVKARWAAEPRGHISDIAFFEPA
ncbi:Zn-ribbon domain-containing OB-fold protein [Spongiibacter sp. UBA1325]|uniref:Zn-ribbon domain-containing OB-fold protein n=1 Tax=Spongiibacter sp. UBA1325 TaxID=1947543 RepID=UPI00257E31DA|nr:OB-fold domain-containing protein [Spongiibacter sp. UBA1325]|tara:strand:+ start:18133 stop:18576 length:444 start_codon:yes stop_codon:yes gene_type:complete